MNFKLLTLGNGYTYNFCILNTFDSNISISSHVITIVMKNITIHSDFHTEWIISL